VRGIIIESIRNLFGSNLKLLLIMDETGAGTTVTDRSGLGHDATLGSAASALSPLVVGLCPSLLFANASATEWSVADHNDFSFGSGGTDTAFSLITVCQPTDVTNVTFLGKFKTATNEREWTFGTVNDKIQMQVSTPTGAQIGRYCNTDITSDEGTTHVYIATLNGGSPQALAGIKIYNNGSHIDDTDYVSGTYTGMTNNTAVVSNSRALAANGNKARELIQIIVNKELSQYEVTRITNLCLAYAAGDI
jgi:hypothetical protein